MSNRTVNSSDFTMNASVCFLGGVLGALANSLFVWFLGSSGVNQIFGVQVAPALSWSWVRPRLLWGGLWGLAFLVVLNRTMDHPWVWGTLVGLLPTLNQFLYVFPVQAQKGYFGLELGVLTPALVLVANTVWGVVTAIWIARGFSPDYARQKHSRA